MPCKYGVKVYGRIVFDRNCFIMCIIFHRGDFVSRLGRIEEGRKNRFFSQISSVYFILFIDRAYQLLNRFEQY